MPRIAGRQRHRANIPGASPKEYYRKNVATPLLDHLTQQNMHTWFNSEDRVRSSIFSLVPANTIKMKPDLKPLTVKLKYWEADLLTPPSIRAELNEWTAQWERRPHDSHPTSLLGCLQHADVDQFPNIVQLLRTGCTLPVGSSEAKRSFSAFRRIKSYLRSRMSQERFFSLALMRIHHSLDIDIKQVRHRYIKAHERRKFHECILKQLLEWL